MRDNYRCENMQAETSVDEEINLMDIYDFLADGWKIILSIAFISCWHRCCDVAGFARSV
jgi:hypothetical protein